MDIPHLSTAKYVQFAMSAPSVILMAMSAQSFSKTIFISTSHNSLLASRIPHLTILHSHHASHISQFFTRITHPTSHNSLLASRIPHLTILYSHHASHISQFTILYSHHTSESTDTRAPIIMAKSPILNTIFRKASHGTLKLT